MPTVHSVLLSAVVGPLGLLSHQLTKVRWQCLVEQLRLVPSAAEWHLLCWCGSAHVRVRLCLLLSAVLQWVFDVLVAVTGRDLRPAAKPKLEKSGPGTITIMPYDK